MNQFNLFQTSAAGCSKYVTRTYSTSFSLAINLLAPQIRGAIYAIYGFVRLADEIVDTFHDYDKKQLLEKFEADTHEAIQLGISLNPILQSFQETARKYNIGDDLISAFLESMKMDLHKTHYDSEKYNGYIFGSADVVGLMCLKVFVNGNELEYNKLKQSAMRLGSAFQKVNFLRDIKNDFEELDRSYFPGVDLNNFTSADKTRIIAEIENDFEEAYKGIRELPRQARLGVFTAYMYYKKLLGKLKSTPAHEIMHRRIRVPNFSKLALVVYSYFYCNTRFA